MWNNQRYRQLLWNSQWWKVIWRKFVELNMLQISLSKPRVHWTRWLQTLKGTKLGYFISLRAHNVSFPVEYLNGPFDSSNILPRRVYFDSLDKRTYRTQLSALLWIKNYLGIINRRFPTLYQRIKRRGLHFRSCFGSLRRI